MPSDVCTQQFIMREKNGFDHGQKPPFFILSSSNMLAAATEDETLQTLV